MSKKDIMILIFKALSWRLVMVIITFSISLFVTKKINIALNIMFIDMIIKTFIYFGHDIIWRKYAFNRSTKKC
jgi:uncharacterized membrane protein